MLVVWCLLLLVAFFPRTCDDLKTDAELAQARDYYAKAYAKESAAEGEPDPVYIQISELAVKAFAINDRVTQFVRKYSLESAHILDVGAGRGYLQDIVSDYTGLDISSSVRRFFHKPFVLGSATAMPFRDGEFDALWSIWVLEHVPQPEQALVEMRRVVKDGGLLYLQPAWDCHTWAAEGHTVRPYSDLDWKGKLTKASIPVRLSALTFSRPIVRTARRASWKVTGGPTRLRYSKVEPNYKKYWEPDSDAINSLDRMEMALWFLSRGDECLNCGAPWEDMGDSELAIVIRVHKASAKLSASGR